MGERTVNIGLSLGADICWPIAYESLLEKLDLGFELGGDRLRFACERVTIEPFDLRQPVKYDLVIDRLTQMLYAYRGDRLVGAASVSTASKGRVTPLGFWSILEKRKFYRSRKYDNAPMPFMQRIDEYGIAMHGGNNPGYPASHGCIRLPMKFAEKLYGLTTLGSKVIIEG